MSEVLIQQSAQKKRLGRGLDSLFGGDAASQSPPVAAPEVVLPQSVTIQEPILSSQRQLPIEKLIPNKDQPRSLFEKDKLQELANSIKVHGIVQPIIVRKKEDNAFEIVAGERRWRAAQLAGLKDVPVIIQDLDTQTTLEIALIENIQRSDLNPMEEARAYQKLLTNYNMTQQQLADRVGKERVTVANFLRLLSLDNQVQELVEHGHISFGHAKVLAGVLASQEQMRIAKEIVDKNLTVRATEKLINQLKRDPVTSTELNEADAKHALRLKAAQTVAEELQKKLGTKVSIDYTDETKGRLAIHFYSDDQLNNIIDVLREN